MTFKFQYTKLRIPFLTCLNMKVCLQDLNNSGKAYHSLLLLWLQLVLLWLQLAISKEVIAAASYGFSTIYAIHDLDIQMEVERRSRQELEEEIRKERQERHELQQQMKEFMKKFMQRPNS
ncbi:hypothetical protein R6Q59_030136 [Mikania micrantha]